MMDSLRSRSDSSGRHQFGHGKVEAVPEFAQDPNRGNASNDTKQWVSDRDLACDTNQVPIGSAVRTEKQKMLAGELYDPGDADLTRERARCRDLCQSLNATCEDQRQKRQLLLAELFGSETDAWIQPPFFCDYGTNIALGEKVFFNFNCVVLDVAKVTIGNNVLFGPAVQIYTATHPISAAERRNWLESAKPITIGSDVWVGGATVICPGVSIGDRSVIGAGSVVTRDVPSDVIAAGNPARVIRQVPPDPPEGHLSV